MNQEDQVHNIGNKIANSINIPGISIEFEDNYVCSFVMSSRYLMKKNDEEVAQVVIFVNREGDKVSASFDRDVFPGYQNKGIGGLLFFIVLKHACMLAQNGPVEVRSFSINSLSSYAHMKNCSNHPDLVTVRNLVNKFDERIDPGVVHTLDFSSFEEYKTSFDSPNFLHITMDVQCDSPKLEELMKAQVSKVVAAIGDDAPPPAKRAKKDGGAVSGRGLAPVVALLAVSAMAALAPR
jgi:hypothetical protein